MVDVPKSPGDTTPLVPARDNRSWEEVADEPTGIPAESPPSESPRHDDFYS